MKYLSLNYIKQHSRIDFDCDDELLEMYADAAEETVMDLIKSGQTVDEGVAALAERYGKLPARIYQASLLLVENMYTYRGVVSPTHLSPVHYNFDLMIKPFMQL